MIQTILPAIVVFLTPAFIWMILRVIGEFNRVTWEIQQHADWAKGRPHYCTEPTDK